MKINLKQKKFADEYIISGNIYKSAIKAGYSENYAKGNAKKLLENERVKKYIDERLEKISSKKIAEAQEVIEYLTSIMRGEGTEQVPLLMGDGMQQLVDKEINIKERLKAAELLGKRYGIFTEKMTLEVEPITIVNDLEKDENIT